MMDCSFFIIFFLTDHKTSNAVLESHGTRAHHVLLLKQIKYETYLLIKHYCLGGRAIFEKPFYYSIIYHIMFLQDSPIDVKNK